MSRQLRRRLTNRTLETLGRTGADPDLTLSVAIDTAATACAAYRLPWPEGKR